MIAYVAAAVFLVLFAVGMLRDRRRFRNAVFLGLATAMLAIGMVDDLVEPDDRALKIAVTASLLVVGYLSFLLLCFLGYAFVYERKPVRGDVDYIVVLGSTLQGPGRVSPLLASRLDRARAVYEAQEARGAKPLILASGGRGTDEVVPEAVAMTDHLVARGVPAERVVPETRSTTTDENLRFSGVIMAEAGPDYRCLVVTSNYHAFRAAMAARRAGVKAQVIGSPTAARLWPRAMVREFAAVFLTRKLVNLGICAALVLVAFAAWWQG